ncbi:MAG: hypothetical protein EZS28_009364 [Streblomastix strix]|uniref:Uncharacterized protein n=1 Tax=Streblomastix strix TaxID=222440 RepID=A0A5J4WKP5_9EUKA|nr:MAG: hypothetical protein EZS28_009364 [Streblomastix strix]
MISRSKLTIKPEVTKARDLIRKRKTSEVEEHERSRIVKDNQDEEKQWCLDEICLKSEVKSEFGQSADNSIQRKDKIIIPYFSPLESQSQPLKIKLALQTKEDTKPIHGGSEDEDEI